MSQSIAQAAIYLIQTVFGIYTFIVLLRLVLQWSQANFYNPVSQFIVKMTNPILNPIRKFVPKTRLIDIASIIAVLVIQMISISLIFSIIGLSLPLIHILLAWSLTAAISSLLNLYLIALLIVIIASWIAPNSHHPVMLLLYQLCDPIMKPARKLLPPMSGIDLSPLLVFIAINLLKILIVQSMVTSFSVPTKILMGV